MESQKIAIIIGSSERCMPMTRQFLLSFHNNVIPYVKSNIEFHVHLYKCNFNIESENYFRHRIVSDVDKESFSFNTFLNEIQFDKIPIPNLRIITHDCSSQDFKNHFPLPDIAIYQDFCDKFVCNKNDYSYLMFCHNDIAFFEKTDLIDSMISLLDGSRYDIITKCSTNFNNNISIRFHPAMIFIKSITFQLSYLSFINNFKIFDNENFRIFTDGGAGLMSSYYHKNNNSIKRPYTDIPHTWFQHIRALGDTGVEFCYHKYKDSPEFARVIKSAQKYVDLAIYG